MEAINYFNSVEFMEQKCPKCQSKIEYDVTTKWNEKLKSHVCLECGEVLK